MLILILFSQFQKLIALYLVLRLKKKYLNIKNPKNLEKITKIFFNQRRKMIKNPLKQIFKNPNLIVKKLNLNTDLRPQNLTPLKYIEMTKAFEDQLIN